MKKFLIIIIIQLLITASQAQSCLSDGITFSHQTQIDSFPINYPGCKNIEGFVEISGEDIINFDSLHVLESIGRYLDIRYNSISNLHGLDNLISIGEGLNIVGNYNLIDLSGLESLITIGGILWMSSDYGMVRLTGIENLSSIGGSLYSLENHSLMDISSLKNVTSINGDIWIASNYVLTSLEGLDNIAANTINRIDIVNNPLLSACNVKSICDYLAKPNGNVIIGPNTSGCNSEQEVEDACASLGTNSHLKAGVFSLYSSSSNSILIIETGLKGFMSIINLNGKQVLNQQISESKTQIDVSALPTGLYVCRFISENDAKTEKFIKY